NSELGVNLRREKETLESLGLSAEVRLRRGSVLEEILAETRERNYDLVVTGSALSRTLRTYVLGDISREIVNRSNCPVLVVRSQNRSTDLRSHLRLWKRRPARKGAEARDTGPRRFCRGFPLGQTPEGAAARFPPPPAPLPPVPPERENGVRSWCEGRFMTGKTHAGILAR